jgi:hypothetical protein
MEQSELRTKLLSVITEEPGVTLNGMFAHVKEELSGKFPPVYNTIKALRDDGTIKVDGKKKNTGHYLNDAEIPDTVPKSTATVRQITGETPFFQKTKKATKRYVVEKNPEPTIVVDDSKWKLIDEDDISEPMKTLFDQCVRCVPQQYRMRDTTTGTILHERIPDHKHNYVPTPAGS